jgi:LysM repeat protein
MRRVLIAALAVAFSMASADSHGFAHVVQPGEALAQIADRVYGDPKRESVLVGANALDAKGGTIITPGMRLEIPSPARHVVVRGETWFALSLAWLGASDLPRAELLARTNKGVSWVQPVEGQEIEIPAVLTYIAGDGESVTSIAQRFWGNGNRGWELNAYNGHEGVTVRRAEVILVPMPGLRLTEVGRAEERAAAERDGASAMSVEPQRKADAEMPQLLADIRYGRYAEAVARGNRILGGGALTRPQLATLHRNLLEAYVALDARAAASAACAAWRANDPNPVLNPTRVSPKIRVACTQP